MIVNKEYFNADESKFKGIRRDTLAYIDIFENYAKTSKFSCKFEDFMATLGTHLNRNGYSIRKIEKWYKKVNNNIQILAKEVFNEKYKK